MKTQSLDSLSSLSRLALVALAVAGGQSYAATASETWSSDFQLQAAHGYDSAVSVDQLDAYSRQGDNYWQFKFNNKSQWQASERITIKAGASLNDKRYDTVEIINTRITQANISPSFKLGHYTLSARADIADATLNGEGFLTFKQINAALGKKISPQFFVRGALTHNTKSFDTFTTRDANNQSISGNLFWLRPTQNVIALGLSHEQEDATDNAYDYTGNTLSVSYQSQYFAKALKLTVSGQWSQRDYETVYRTESSNTDTPNTPFPFLEDEPADAPTISTVAFTREDTRIKLSTDISYALNDTISLIARASFSDIQSNDARVDIDKYDVQAGVQLSF